MFCFLKSEKEAHEELISEAAHTEAHLILFQHTLKAIEIVDKSWIDSSSRVGLAGLRFQCPCGHPALRAFADTTKKVFEQARIHQKDKGEKDEKK